MNEEEEDSAKPINMTSKAVMKKKKKKAAAVADKEKSQTNKASSVERLTSTPRKRSSAKDNQDDEALAGRPKKKRNVGKAKNVCYEPGRKEVVKKKYMYECSAAGCTTKARRKGGVCVRHGAKLKRCSHEGCTNVVVNRGVCTRHGAKRPQCNSEGCTNIAVKGGVCRRHGAKVPSKLCSHQGCTNISKQGGVCVRHGAKLARCSSEGCINYAQRGGVCIRHGAKLKQCEIEGCQNNAKSGGVFVKHGAKVEYKRCNSESQPREDAAEKKIEEKSSERKDKLSTLKSKRKSLEEDQPGGEYFITKKLSNENSVYGCTNYAKGEVHMSNAANVKQCRGKGCTNKVESGGVCRDCKWHEVISCSSNGYTSMIQNGEVDDGEDLSRVDSTEISSTDAQVQHDDSISRSDQEVEIDSF